jgi:hypothetical protein
MGCRGCGKDNLAVIAKASAEITLSSGRQAMPSGSGKEKRPQYLETACRNCGEIIRQSFAHLRRNPGTKRKVFCGVSCRKEWEAVPHAE